MASWQIMNARYTKPGLRESSFTVAILSPFRAFGIICESDVRAALVWLSGSDVRQEEPGMFSQGKAREAGTGVGWRPGEEPWLYPH